MDRKRIGQGIFRRHYYRLGVPGHGEAVWHRRLIGLPGLLFLSVIPVMEGTKGRSTSWFRTRRADTRDIPNAPIEFCDDHFGARHEHWRSNVHESVASGFSL